ncbi:hypothetical protein D5086_006891 [Populus alba]|uniref:Uncharacterized protein n=1 Tax=Populus alba TaxID=43335 RepID=A0ACC4CLU7_POPAL
MRMGSSNQPREDGDEQFHGRRFHQIFTYQKMPLGTTAPSNGPKEDEYRHMAMAQGYGLSSVISFITSSDVHRLKPSNA